MTKNVLVVGDPVGGYRFYGPLKTEKEAMDFADFAFTAEKWWVADMTAPPVSLLPRETTEGEMKL
jgi:hypothetical protein